MSCQVPEVSAQVPLKTGRRSKLVLVWKIVRKINWISVLTLVVLPLWAMYAGWHHRPSMSTLKLAWVYYNLTSFCVVAGYHRYYAHKSFVASAPLQYIFAIFGPSAGIGSIRWWAAAHRAHHRYADTERDPHSIRRGFVFSHIGWMLLRPRYKVASSIKDCQGEDLKTDAVVNWQDKNYYALGVLSGLVVPGVLNWALFGDFAAGVIYVGVLRAVLVQHGTFLVNSIGHMSGTQPFDDRKSCRNNWILSVLTFGEGNCNFHFEFSTDYRNGYKLYDYDPIKWMLAVCQRLSIVKSVYRTTEAAISQCLLQHQQKLIDKRRAKLNWGIPIDKLPVISPQEFRRLAVSEAPKRALIAVAGIVHDITPFVNDHPGGLALLKASIGKDATNAFNGAVYDHSTAAHNLLATMRIAVLSGGTEKIVWKQQQMENKDVPLKQDSEGRKIVRTGEQATIIKKPIRTAGAA